MIERQPRAHRRKLGQLFKEADGRCGYCDGATWMIGERHDNVRARLGIPKGVHGSNKLLEAAKATREHLKKRADGGQNVDNLMLSCHACNSRRGDSTPQEHRTDMQVLVAAGLHPTNRPKHITDPQHHHKAGLKALKKLRAGQPIGTSS